MSGDAIFVGNYSYIIDPVSNTVQLNAAEIENSSFSSTGTIRLELWLTTSPWSANGSNVGYEIATDQIYGSSNGTLGPYQYFSNITNTVTYLNHPPAGTYYITLAAAEYTGTSPSIDDGFQIDSTGSFSTLLIVNSNGSLSPPTYTLTPAAPSMNEGTTDNIALQTTGVAAGTSLTYTISGIAASRITNNSLTGTVTVDSNGEAIIPLSVINDYYTDGPTTAIITIGNNLASTSILVNDTSLTPPINIPLSFGPAVGSFIAAPNQTIALSSLFNLPANGNNPTYIDVTLLDRFEYPQGDTPILGYLADNGSTIPGATKSEISYFFGTVPTDANEAGAIFTYQPSTGRYYSNTYGYFDQLTYTASPYQYDNTDISIFATNSPGLINNLLQVSPSNFYLDPESLGALAGNHIGLGVIGTVDVVTGTSVSGTAPTHATPSSIISAANAFLGKVWNNDGCWVLASNISAQAGASLPITSPGGADAIVNGENLSAPISNGEWIVAYYGGYESLYSTPTIASAEATIRPGDIVVMQGTNGAHITTVVSGSGASAMTIDNAQTGSNYVDAHDVTIGKNDSIGQEFSIIGADPSTITVYRLDTPTIAINTPNETISAGSSITLSPLFTANDAGGAGSLPITEYAFFDVGTGSATSDSFTVNGGCI